MQYHDLRFLCREFPGSPFVYIHLQLIDDGSTHNGLIGLEVDAGHSQQRGVHHAHQCGGHENAQDHDDIGDIGGHIAHHQRAAHSAHDHDTLETEVNDAGVLGDTAAQCHKDQHRGESQRILHQKQHY